MANQRQDSLALSTHADLCLEMQAHAALQLVTADLAAAELDRALDLEARQSSIKLRALDAAHACAESVAHGLGWGLAYCPPKSARVTRALTAAHDYADAVAGALGWGLVFCAASEG